jgi:hypothetical protein
MVGKQKKANEKQVVTTTVTDTTALQQEQLRRQITASGPSSSAEVHSTTEKKDKSSAAISEIERIFQSEVFETDTFKRKDSWFCPAEKKAKAELLQKGILEIITEAKAEL